MRTKPVAHLTQNENVTFYFERRINFGFYNAEFWELVLPLSGETEISYDGRKREIHRGDLVFLAPDLKRRVTLLNEGSEYFSLRVKPEMIKEVFDCFDKNSYATFTALDVFASEISETGIQDIVSSVNDVHIAEEEERSILLKKLCYCVFLQLLPFHKYNGGGDVTQRALTVMNDARNVSLRLPDVAEKVGCSEEYLVRCFKKSGLDTPNTIFKRVKLRYAKSVLTSTKISVSEVATLIGFRSVGHFNKLYFTEYGVCPGADKTR